MTIRIGIIGCGFMGATHSRCLRALHRRGIVDAPVVALCDTDIERARSMASHHAAEIVTADPAEVLAAVDAVLITTHTSAHGPLVRAAASAGVHVFCEKPLATTAPEVREMLATVQGAGIVHQVGLVLRYSPPFQALADVVGSQQQGRALAAVFRDDQFFPIQGHYDSTWRADVDKAGGGTLIEHSIHDIDVLAWALGPIVEVSARTAAFAGHPGIEDVAVVTLSHESGATSSLTSVWHSILTRPSTRRLEVISERGLAWLDDDRLGPLHLVTDEDSGPMGPDWPPIKELASIEEGSAQAYLRQAFAFVHAVSEGREAHPGFDVALAAHEVADAAYRSARQGGATISVQAT